MHSKKRSFSDLKKTESTILCKAVLKFPEDFGNSSDNLCWNGSLIGGTDETHGLLQLAPESDVRRCIDTALAFGLLFDYHKAGCFKCFSHAVDMRQFKKKNPKDGNWTWYCSGCQSRWSVRRSSIFQGMKWTLSSLIVALYYLLNAEISLSFVHQHTAIPVKTLTSFRFRIEVQAGRWNLLNTPDMSGDVYFDESLVSKVKRAGHVVKKKDGTSEHCRSAKVRSRQWWMLVMCNKSRKVIVGLTQRRNRGTLAAFCLTHLSQTKHIDYNTDGWPASKAVDYDNVPGFDITHGTCNHSKGEWVNKETGASINTVESENWMIQSFILNQLNGASDHFRTAMHLQFFQCLRNQADNHMEFKSLMKRFINFAKGCTEVMYYEWNNGAIELPTKELLKELPTMFELQKGTGIKGFCDEALTELSEKKNGNDGYFKRGMEMATNEDVIWSQITKSGEICGEVMSQRDSGKQHMVSVAFKKLTNDVKVLLDADNVHSECGNYGCSEHSKKIPTLLCKHAFALLFLRKEGTGDCLNFLDYCAKYGSSVRTEDVALYEKALRNDGRDDVWDVERILSERVNEETGVTEFLTMWAPWLYEAEVYTSRMGASLEWMEENSFKEAIPAHSTDASTSAMSVPTQYLTPPEHYKKLVDVMKFVGLPRLYSW